MKKQWIAILGLAFVMACNSGMERDAIKSTDAAENEMIVSAEDMEETASVPEATKAGIDYEMIASQKLQEYVDLRNLMSEHPEFKSDLANQLANFTLDSLYVFEMAETVELSQVSIRDRRFVNDSLTEIKLDFNLQMQSGSRRDSILALFQIKSIEIDGQYFNSTKVTFESLKD